MTTTRAQAIFAIPIKAAYIFRSTVLATMAMLAPQAMFVTIRCATERPTSVAMTITRAPPMRAISTVAVPIPPTMRPSVKTATPALQTTSVKAASVSAGSNLPAMTQTRAPTTAVILRQAASLPQRRGTVRMAIHAPSMMAASTAIVKASP